MTGAAEYDAIVVGAGPAGSATGVLLADVTRCPWGRGWGAA